jgi:hypothetical protein
MPNHEKSSQATKTTTMDDRRFLDEHRDKLSDSTLRANWIGSPDDREERPGQTLATRNHDVIKRWAEERKGQPATVSGTEHDDHFGVLRFDFPGYGGDKLEHVDWSRWFQTFDDRQLVFVFQEHKTNGNQSNFYHFDSPFREHD